MEYKKRVVSREDFDNEREYFAEHGSYRSPGTVTDYLKSIESTEPRKAARLYGDVAHDNLTAVKPDYGVVNDAVGGLRRLGEEEEAKDVERRRKSKLEATTTAAMMRAGWNTMVRSRVKAGLKEATTGVFIASILGAVGLSVGRITGNVIGTAETSANWSLILGFIALLTGLFLILNYKKDK